MTEGAEVPSSSINRAQGNQLEIKTFALKYLPITTASEQETLVSLFEFYISWAVQYQFAKWFGLHVGEITRRIEIVRYVNEYIHFYLCMKFKAGVECIILICISMAVSLIFPICLSSSICVGMSKRHGSRSKTARTILLKN